MDRACLCPRTACSRAGLARWSWGGGHLGTLALRVLPSPCASLGVALANGLLLRILCWCVSMGSSAPSASTLPAARLARAPHVPRALTVTLWERWLYRGRVQPGSMDQPRGECPASCAQSAGPSWPVVSCPSLHLEPLLSDTRRRFQCVFEILRGIVVFKRCAVVTVRRYGSSAGLSSATCSGPCTASAGSYCGAGMTSSSGAVCPAGKWSSAAATNCTLCAAGLFGSSSGLTSSSCR